MDINNPFYIEVLESLNKNNVEFILVGGLAVAYYGYHRYTGDMDLWLKPSVTNLNNLYKALEDDLRFDKESIEQIKKLRDIENPTPIRLLSDDNVLSVDLMTNTFQKLFTWEECYKNSNLIQLEYIKVPVVHIKHLITIKENTQRLDNSLKDLADAEELKKIMKIKKGGFPSSNPPDEDYH